MGQQREQHERRLPPEPRELTEPPWTIRERVSLAWEDGSIRWLVGILVVVVLGVGLFAMRSQPVETVVAPQVVRSGTPAPTSDFVESASASPVANPSVDASATGAQTPAQVIVHVTGPVRNPGVVTLAAGSRVTDAVAAAGGLTKGRVQINLARVLVDGEQIDVGAAHDAASTTGAAGAGGVGTVPNGAIGGGTAAAGKISINKASASQLEELPRVGPVLASKIIEFRTQFGGFRSIDQLREVSGIGDATFAQLAPLVTL
ncbi:MAG: ComEA family DNA-binding protein [Candidatus Nanopelagicales bacterium]